MSGYLLPLTQDSWQVMTLDVVIDGEEFHAQVEIRYLPAPDQWVLSIWDHAAGKNWKHGHNFRNSHLNGTICDICERSCKNDI